MATPYTTAECDTQIATIEARLDEVASLPDEHNTGKSGYSGLDKTLAALEDRKETWQLRRQMSLNGGRIADKTRCNA